MKLLSKTMISTFLDTKKRHGSGGDLLFQGLCPSIIGAEGLND